MAAAYTATTKLRTDKLDSIRIASARFQGFRSSMLEREIAVSVRLLSVPYVAGGNDPNSGLDCMGLVREYLLRAYLIEDISPERWMAVSPRDMKPGDVLCFSESRMIGHVGVVIEPGVFLHTVEGIGAHRTRVVDWLKMLRRVLRHEQLGTR